MMVKIPLAIGNKILPLKFSFSISYGISLKYLPVLVSVWTKTKMVVSVVHYFELTVRIYILCLSASSSQLNSNIIGIL